MNKETKIEMLSDIADTILRVANPTMKVDIEDTPNCFIYTDEAQDIFNYIYDTVENIIDRYIEEVNDNGIDDKDGEAIHAYPL